MTEHSFTLSKAGEEKLKKIGYAKLAAMCNDVENNPCPCTSIAGAYCQFTYTWCDEISERDWKIALNRRKK